ncbi:hypothetical protein E2C01_083329 [Portunus trituberculatus]|uniref:Uncharacterized protein n=1 Tax=Portunus trituberculatus TaxID=210409 RepID=A0A5B7J4C8_PORTR|nr:hypothetical protein [Portunus trituberculatus]
MEEGGGKLDKLDKSKSLKMMYMNIDGVLSSRLEMGNYLKEKKPTIVCLPETKLCEAIKIDLDNNNNVWMKNRVGKGGAGVMIMARKELMVNQVVYGNDKVEVMSIKVKKVNKEILITVANVPPQTSTWSRQDYEGLIKDS